MGRPWFVTFAAWRWLRLCLGLLAVLVCLPGVGATESYRWRLPPGFPEPRVPADNPMSDEKVALGRHLFYDTRLSSTGTFACATCHQQARAFADDKGRGLGATGEVHPRGPMSLTNVAYSPVLTWANPTVRRLEEQALVPMFGTDPIELGLKGQERALLARLAREPRYRDLFAAAFPGEADPFSIEHITGAIATFERTLISGRSPYDRYRTTMDASAIPPAAHRGEDLFFSERLSCFRCHSGFNFTATVDSMKLPAPVVAFHNNGLYNVDGRGAYPPPNTGVHAVTGDPRDMGQFKPPTLRNIALTAPYMHDGSLPTLEAVIAHYAAGGRAGGRGNSPIASPFLKGFSLSTGETQDLIAFLESLTDTTFTTDPALSDPWNARGGLATAAPTAPLAPVTPAVPPGGSKTSQATAARPSLSSPRHIDFDAALRGLAMDPAVSLTTVPDGDLLALVAAVLADAALDRRATGGVEHRVALAAFESARATAVDDIRILSAAYPTAADVIAGYALLGRAAFAAFAAQSKDLGPRLKGDYTAAFALERWLAPAGDADGDGVSNVAEYRATRAQGRAAFVAAALDPAVGSAGIGRPGAR